jgi:excisionase family DNA binding protein
MKMAKEKPQGPQWYTIREAAAYLQVGEPTIYRWMRDGRITFRKVGDSTRFLKVDLDEVIQVFPSRQDVKKVTSRCAFCGHEELVPGRLQSSGLIYFRPGKTKFWTFRDANVKTNALMCTHCGGISWYGDTEKLETLREADEESDE